MNAQALDKLKDKIIIVSEEDRWDDEFKSPTQYFIVNAFSEGVYFKTNSRANAQKWADMLYGVNFYIVRKDIKAAIR